MIDVRWTSPFEHTIPFSLFHKHFTEINDAYWAYVPAASTIEKRALEGLQNEAEDPRKYFLISDEDDRRVANTYSEWKASFREFGNYTRLNIIMLLSSCFETYLRTVVSLAFESKPACILGCPDKIDGVFLLKSKNGYGEFKSKEYLFKDSIESVCSGDWIKRAGNYRRFFNTLPFQTDICKLDELRIKRNNIAHFIARKKEEYESTISPEPIDPIRISSQALKDYFALIYRTAIKIDEHLHKDYIGSYDILKFFYFFARKNNLMSEPPTVLARELRKQLGSRGLQTVGQEYYKNLMEYFCLNDEDCVFRYSRNACIKEVNRRIADISISANGKKCDFSAYFFRMFCKKFKVNENPDYTEMHKFKNCEIYFYSDKMIDSIVSFLQNYPNSFLNLLREQ